MKVVATMATTTGQQHDAAVSGTHTPTDGIVAGVAGGAAGGMVFGMMMQMMGRMPMVASLAGSNSVAIGWATHLAISMVLGAGFGLLLGGRRLTIGTALASGGVYGMVWWVLGALILMPLRLGMPVIHLDAMAWQSLMGHLMFGMVLGLVARALGRATRIA